MFFPLKSFLTGCLTLALLSAPVYSPASEPLIFSTSSVEPWGFFDDNEVAGGLLVEFGEQLQAEMLRHSSDKYDFQNVIRPYPRVINDIKTGRADFAVLFNSPESNRIGESVGEVARFQILVTGLNTAQPIRNLDDLIGQPIGYVRGSKYGPVFDDNHTLSKVSLDSMEKGVDMLLKGRLGALVCLDHTLYYALQQKKLPIDTTKTLLVLGEARTDLYISRRSQKQVYIDEVSQALKQLKDSGALDRIFDLKRYQ